MTVEGDYGKAIGWCCCCESFADIGYSRLGGAAKDDSRMECHT